MIEKDVLVVTKYGRQPGFAACPDEPGRFPAIILYMDAPGFREELRDQARRIAKHGYFCLLPDLYYRLGTIRFDIPRRNDAMSVVIRGAMQSLTNAAIYDDTAGMLAFLDAQDKVAAGAGRLRRPLHERSVRGDRCRALPAHEGGRVAVRRGHGHRQPDSPHLQLGQVKGELYLAFAEVDPSVPANVIPDLKAALAKTKVKHVLETIPGTHHGYCFAARADYNPVAAEATWTKLFDLWDRNLK